MKTQVDVARLTRYLARHTKLVQRTVPSWYTFAYIDQSRSKGFSAEREEGPSCFSMVFFSDGRFNRQKRGAQEQHIL